MLEMLSIALSTFALRFFPIEQKHILRSRCLKVNQGERKVSYSRGRARHVVVLEKKVTLWETDAAE